MTDRYLELLKKTLLFSLWEQPPLPINALNYTRHPAQRTIISAVSKLLARKHLYLSQRHTPGTIDWAEYKVWYSDSMANMERLNNVQYCLENVLVDRIPGDLIETGVWRGGSCILMAAILATHNIRDRRIFVADSFQGLPEPTHPKDVRLCDVPFLSVSLEQVKHNFEKYDLLSDQIVFLKGWFADTLPSAPISKLALLRLDGDLYSSTTDSLTHLYPKLSRGGFCIIDDYALVGCRQATDNYRFQNHITAPIRDIDGVGVYWRKE